MRSPLCERCGLIAGTQGIVGIATRADDTCHMIHPLIWTRQTDSDGLTTAPPCAPLMSENPPRTRAKKRLQVVSLPPVTLLKPNKRLILRQLYTMGCGVSAL